VTIVYIVGSLNTSDVKALRPDGRRDQKFDLGLGLELLTGISLDALCSG